MDKEDQDWTTDAMNLCSRAKEKGISILFVRPRDNGEADIVVTSAETPDMVRALYPALSKDED